MQGVPGRAYSKSSPNLSSCQNASDRARKLGRHSATNAHRTCKPSARCRTSERKKSVPVTAAVPWMMARSSSSERLNCAPSFSGTVGFIDWPGLTPRPVDYRHSGGSIKPEKAAVPAPSLTLLSCHPRMRFARVVVVEIANLRSGKRTAENAHPLLPSLVSDHRDTFDVAEMFQVELDVLPQRTGVPAMKIHHLEQHAQTSALLEPTLELWHELFVIFCQRACLLNELQGMSIRVAHDDAARGFRCPTRQDHNALGHK